MQYIYVLFLALGVICLDSCSVISKDKSEIEKIAEEVIEGIAEDLE